MRASLDARNKQHCCRYMLRHYLAIVSGPARQSFPRSTAGFSSAYQRLSKPGIHLYRQAIIFGFNRHRKPTLFSNRFAEKAYGIMQALFGGLYGVTQVYREAHFAGHNIDGPWPDIPFSYGHHGGSSLLLDHTSDLQSHVCSSLQSISPQIHRGRTRVIGSPFYVYYLVQNTRDRLDNANIDLLVKQNAPLLDMQFEKSTEIIALRLSVSLRRESCITHGFGNGYAIIVTQ